MGKPSGGCGTCRARRVKCDEGRPICNRCRKARRTCSGYRDPHSIWFRDESKSVIQRLKTSAGSDPGLPAAQASAVVRLKWKTADGPTARQLPSPILNFTLDHTFQATCFFLNTFKWFNTFSLVERSTRHAPESTAALGEKAMMAGIASVGLANLASLQKSPSLRLSARREYATALQLTNAALRDPVMVKEDTTLTAIVCLSLFEIIVCERQDSLESWINHSKGIAALLELRGGEQLQRESGAWMFQVLRNEVLTGCLQKGLRFPPALLDIPDRMASKSQTYPFSTDGNRLMKIVAKFCDLQADIRTGIISDSSEILSIARAIDSELEDLTGTFSSEFVYALCTRPPSHPPPPATNGYNFAYYHGTYHMYQTLWACNVWNNYRYVRILVNTVILSHLPPVAPAAQSGPEYESFRAQCVRPRDRMRQLATDICCSVPFKFGVAGHEEMDGVDPVMTRAGTGFTLLLPLYVAVLVDGVSSPIYTWVMNCFHVIGRVMGIHTAVALMEMLKDHPGVVGWIDRMETGEKV
ncbi:hypothetical protein BO70DRAFT_312204 [Aspergillus heteromorphus CBS 117.55]|uniref:Zn(2)-C6 fungal-type domain-containing protein n=1 Tax=Aspergillus heteromorphus CBS 117.55 TaxID=1448321 RepID=A0A317WL03_9EURO|nr:uncharacterized protein BO70DRAFT_312204 [Aspergillus heteromorphus CBS 117.55]PWY85982.1 hypothetical protein BO70DRAFT_312204 [Aspergillus heteromorphus CBS 117.55]